MTNVNLTDLDETQQNTLIDDFNSDMGGSNDATETSMYVYDVNIPIGVESIIKVALSTTELNIYINGSVVGTLTGSDVKPVRVRTPESVRIGGTGFSSHDHFDGTIRYFKFYDSVS